MLTFNLFTHFSSISIVDFEQVKVAAFCLHMLGIPTSNVGLMTQPIPQILVKILTKVFSILEFLVKSIIYKILYPTNI